MPLARIYWGFATAFLVLGLVFYAKHIILWLVFLILAAAQCAVGIVYERKHSPHNGK